MIDARRLCQTALAVALVAAAVAIAPRPAAAQYVDRDDDIRFEDEFDTHEFAVAPRVRAVVVPDFILGAFYDRHASHWDGESNLAYGLEFVWRKVGEYEIVTAVEYADLSMPSDFWLQEGDSKQDATYTELDLQLLSLTVSGYWYWDVEEWFAPYVGGGIGAGVVMGDIVKWEPRESSECYAGLGTESGWAPNSCFGDDGEPSPEAFEDPETESEIPPVVPVVNLAAGLRFNIAKHGMIKLEAGFYDYFFVGLAGGAQW